MACAVAAKLMQQFRFDLVFKNIRPGEAYRAFVRCRGDRRSAAHGIEFVLVLEQAHLVEQRAHVADLVRSADAAAHLGLYIAAQFEDALIPSCVAAQRVEQRGLVAHQLGQLFIQQFYGKGLIKAELLLRGIGTIAVAVPDLAFQILFAAKQDRFIFNSGNQYQHCFRFPKTGQVIKIAAMAIVIMRVGIARHFRCGGDYRDAVLHLLEQTGAALGVDSRVCSHDALCNERGVFCNAQTWMSSSASRCGVPTSTHKPW